MENKTRQEQKTACVRVRTPVEGLKGELGKAYGEVMAILSGQGVQPTGAPFAVYYNMDMKDLDVEIGFPVSQSFQPSGRVRPSTLPGGRTAVCVHKGAYDSIGDSYSALSAFIAQNKATPKDLCYESYLTDPQVTKPEELLTEINFPLND